MVRLRHFFEFGAVFAQLIPQLPVFVPAKRIEALFGQNSGMVLSAAHSDNLPELGYASNDLGTVPAVH